MSGSEESLAAFAEMSSPHPVFLAPPAPIDPECERYGCDCDGPPVVLTSDPPRFARLGCDCHDSACCDTEVG